MIQKETHLEGFATIPSVAELRAPSETSISIITPPKVPCFPSLSCATCLISIQVTLSILQAALPLGVPAVWIQPGAADESVVEWVKENGMEDRVIYGGPCILVEGDGIRSML